MVTLDLTSKTHPKAEVLEINLKRAELVFRWLDGPYTGECSTPIDLETLTSLDGIPNLEDCAKTLEVVAKDADTLLLTET